MPAIPRDLVATILSFAYVGTVVGASEVLRRLAGRGSEFTRKFVHVGVSLWIIPTLLLYTKWYWAAAPAALAVVGNYVSLRKNVIRSIERGERHDYGTVLFPLSFIICIAAFFSSAHREAAAAGIIIMGLGDASAAIAGRAWGRHRYRLLGASKSLEGSAAMFVVSLVGAFAALVIFGVGAGPAVATAAACAVAGTALEAAGRNGLDNLTVPVACSVIAYYMLAMLSGGAA